MVPHECLTQVAFKSHSRVILLAASSVQPTSTRRRHRLDDPSASRPANGPTIRIVIIGASPVSHWGPLRNSAPLRVLAKPSASALTNLFDRKGCEGPILNPFSFLDGTEIQLKAHS